MRNFIFIISIFVFLQSSAQQTVFTGTKNKKAENMFGDALKYFTQMDNLHALTTLNKCLKEDPKFIDAMMLKADIYEQNEEYKKALSIYDTIVSLKKEFQIPYYKIAVVAIDDGDYDKALENITKYEVLKGDQIDPAKVKKVKSTATFGKDALLHPVPFAPKNLGPTVNSVLDEYFPGLTIDDQTLIFTRFEKNYTENFYISKRIKDGWSSAQNLGYPINTDGNEGTISVSSDGQYVFYTACNRETGAGSCDLYFSALDGDRWSEPRNLGFPINTINWESQPSVSFDGRTLYFTSNRPGGYGKMDIWKSTYGKGHWSVPQNLGPTINSEGNDEGPFISKDDKTLYFTSDGHPGMGKTDFFVARKQIDGRWGEPKNLGYPINNQYDQRCMIISTNGKDAYVATKREDSYGGLDLYAFELYDEARPQKTGFIKGVVYDSRTMQKLKARIELIDLETGKPFIETVSNKISGEFIACLQGNKNYALNVSCDGYLFYSDNFSLKDQSSVDPLKLDVPLNPMIEGERVVLKNVFFDVDKFILREESKIELGKLLSFLKLNPQIRIEVGGHTDNTGDKARNSVLSANRAKAVHEYLIQNGIEDFRLTYKGYADSQPIADNKTEAGRQKNRRTEFKITSK